MLLRSGPVGQKCMFLDSLYIFPGLSSQQVGIEYYSNQLSYKVGVVLASSDTKLSLRSYLYYE